MAARFWSGVLAGQALLALSLGWFWGRMTGASTAASAVSVVLIAALLLALGEGVTFALAHHYDSSAPAPRPLQRRVCTGVQAFCSELVYFSAAWLAMISRPWRPVAVTTRAAPGTRARAAETDTPSPILLLHGFSCNAAIWSPLRRRLRAAAIGPLCAPDLEPLGADLDSYLPATLRALEALEQLCCRAPVTLIGHSSGGLVARALLRRIEPSRIRQLITLATPHHGTALARCAVGAQAAQLRPGSAWLQALDAAENGPLPVPTLCIYSLDDNIVAPARSALLPGARPLPLEGLGHFGVLHARAALDLIEASFASPAGVSR